VREPDGIVVFSGCSHSGILNMIEAAVEEYPDEPIKAVFGGFHLVGNPLLGTMALERAEVERLGRQILELVPHGRIFTGHCTGRRAFAVLREVMGPALQGFPTGATVEV
jgi:7,8-dihydropterin-6-yl-methyl-4-(beta-D-ribofuranosyl)aminobenzene 5'-phosphate synthase